jgi:protein TonB
VRPVEAQVATAPEPRKPVRHRRQASVQQSSVVPEVPRVTPQPASPQTRQMLERPEPRRPSANWQHTTVARQQPTSTEEIDPVKAYLALVLAELEQYKYYPQQARRRGLKGQVVLQFVILPDGQVMDPRITHSRGHATFASAALTALRQASPLPPFPPDVKQNRLLVEVPMSYELTER